ncbi:beta propeller repeat protein [Natrinema altunense]|uniref:Twin-arginine translocation signal domain-containing protein n=1 Tax=Natrinema altunense (strain JCM 12890 / CGMCC 1.3731 / AJ2) TaxID=1227494 RepID=L9ZXR0_NATA2|nr:hypothetical protein [Natrinema altunense]ELY91295.1 hypothetical protein C485_01930 [Natrinema altunense JCM 12890]
MTDFTRRSALKVAGASLAAVTVPATVSAAESDWTVVETPVDTTLYDVSDTATNPHAVAGAGLVIERTANGWEVVLQGGPSGNGNDLYGVDTTDDGERLWIVGASGAVGEYDVTTGNLIDRSAPNDFTANFNDVSVTGPAGEADVYVADDSGAIHYSFDNGKEGTWNYEVPGSGSGLKAIECYDTRSGHVIDTNGKVFATDDGVTWDPIGIEDAGVAYYGLDSDAKDDVRVSGGNASVFTYDGSQWVSESLGDATLFDIETEGGTGYTVGSGGAIFELEGGTWARNKTPVGENLKAITTGAVDIAVGSAGTLLEQ